MKYAADFLMSLLGQKDDEGENIVGIKDGAVSVAIYMLKQYRDNQSQITNNNYILFIGDFEEAKELSKHMRNGFDKYGMHYGWLGKHAVMYVDKINPEFINPMKYKEYHEKFFSCCNRENEVTRNGRGTCEGHVCYHLWTSRRHYITGLY